MPNTIEATDTDTDTDTVTPIATAKPKRNRATRRANAAKAKGKAKVAAKGKASKAKKDSGKRGSKKAQTKRKVSPEDFGETATGEKRMFARQQYNLQNCKIVGWKKGVMPIGRTKCFKKGRTFWEAWHIMEAEGFKKGRRYCRKAWQKGWLELTPPKN